MSRGTLVLRLGLGASLVLVFVFVLHGASEAPSLRLAVLAGVGILAVLGVRTRLTAGAAAVGWLASAVADLVAGKDWFALPVRDFVFALLFTALALMAARR